MPVAQQAREPETFALTPGQRLLWDDLAPSGAQLNIGSLVLVPGDLDIDAFYRALAQSLAEHDAFSIRLVADPAGGIPRQRVEPTKPLLQLVDLSAALDPTAAAHARARQLMAAPLDSFGPVLYRSQLLDLGADGCAWLFVANHIAADGWSLALFVDHVLRRYAADIEGEPWEPKIASFVDWAREDKAQNAARLADKAAYWDARLDANSEALLPPPAVPSSTACSLTTRIPSPLHARMAAYCSEHRASPQVLIQAALGVALSQAQARTGWTLLLTSSNRRGAKLRRMSGQHAGVHPFRWDFDADQTMAELLTQVRQSMLQDYRQLPFQPNAGDRSAAVEFGVRFNSYPFEFLLSELEGRPLTILPLRSEAPIGPLEVIYVDLGPARERTVSFSYDPRALSCAEVEAIQAAIFQLIEAVLDTPDQSIAQLDVTYPQGLGQTQQLALAAD